MKKKYLLEIIVFISGAVVMIYEMVGSRILAPYLGTSIFVWTSLIGVILASLSLGYYLGGKLADQKADLKILDIIIFMSALFILVTILGKESLLNLVQNNLDLKSGSLLASIILFGPTSLVLGMVSPYVVKLKMQDLRHSGSTVGNLYALSTLGSIVGTFGAGFFLIPLLGTNNILILLALILILLSILINKQRLIIKILFAVILVLGFFLPPLTNLVVDVDSQYSRIWIREGVRGGRPILALQTDPLGIQSSMFLDDPIEISAPYIKYYDLVDHFNPDFKEALILGGCAYSYPKHFLYKYPQKNIDVVEIDPKMTELAKEYFFLKENQRLDIIHQDARLFLNQNHKKYDLILGDAFNSFLSIPYQLTTQEAIAKNYSALSDNGLVIVNIISALEGPKAKFLQAEYKTYKTIFPQVLLFQVNDKNKNEFQNIILVALKNPTPPNLENNNPYLNEMLKNIYTAPLESSLPILTDDFAPVDHYLSKAI